MKSNTSQSASGVLYALPLLVVALITLAIPCIMLIKTSLTGSAGELSFENWVEVFSSSYDREAIFNSIRFATYQTLLCVVLGTPIAFALLRLTPKARALAMSVINVASSFGGAGLVFAYTLLTGATGVLSIIFVHWLGGPEFPPQGSMTGLNMIMIYVHLPLYLILSLANYGSMRPEWTEAAKMCGSTHWQFFSRVTVPVLAPFVLSNALQIFTWAMGAYAIPYVVTQSPNAVSLLSVEIGKDLEAAIFGLGRAATLATFLMIQAVALTWIYTSLQKRGEKIL